MIIIENLQQIPSKNNEIRLMFKATEDIKIVDFDDKLVVKYYQDLETPDGWTRANELKVGDWIVAEDGELLTIKNIEINNDDIIMYT